jgi:hypothetical protein
MRSWLNELRKSVPFNVVVVAIVGLKTDLLISHFHNSKSSNSNNSAAIEAVPEYEVEQLAQALNVLYVPTSSKLDLNVMTLFTRVAEEVLERRRKGVTVASSSSSLVASSNRMGPNTSSAPSLALDSCNNNKGGKGNFSSQREHHHHQQQRGGIVGLGGANADAGAKKTNSNKNDETTSAVLSPKELYGKYYEKINDETNILYNNNDGIDSTNDHRDDRNAAVTKDKRFSLNNNNNNNNVNTMDDPSNYNPSNENNNNNSHNKRRRKSKGSSLSSPSGCGAIFCMNQGVKNVDSGEQQEEAEGGDGDNYDCDIAMDENDIDVDDDHVKHDNGAGDGSCKNESFFLMCGNPTWCGKTTDTI